MAQHDFHNDTLALNHFADECVIGLTLASNAWTLSHNITSSICHGRNLCELGINSVPFGEGSRFVADLAGTAMAKWISMEGRGDAETLKEALGIGMRMGNCAEAFRDCDYREWNEYVLSVREEWTRQLQEAGIGQWRPEDPGICQIRNFFS